MSNYDEQTNSLNANDFLGGNYLKKEDIEGPTTVQVANVYSEAVHDSPRKKLMVEFREFDKPLILNKTNIKRFARIFQSGDTATWRGPVTLYVEAGVEYAGRVVGGIRVKPAQAKPATQKRPAEDQYENGQAAAYEEPDFL